VREGDLARAFAEAKRKIRYHLAELDALGYDVTLTPRPGPDADDGSTVAVGCCRLPD
jgi:hypothetical protein